MVSISALAAVAVGLLATTTQGAKQCYGLDGKELDSSFTPCNLDADTSACCASNKTDGDICLTSGLCYAQQKPYSGFMYMNGCTDKSGIATECPHICPDATNDWNGGKPVHFWNVLQCSRGKFCCSSDETNCCDDKNNIIQPDIGILARGAAATRTVTVSSGPSGATTITPTSTSSNSNPGTSPGSDSNNNNNNNNNNKKKQCPKDNTAVVGGALGGVLGTALLAALGTVAYLLKKRSSSYKPAPTSDAQKAQELPVQNPVELQGNNYHN